MQSYQSLYINSAEYTPVNAELLPLGGNMPVEDTPFDFSFPATIGSKINSGHEQLRIGRGYCHNYVLQQGPADNPCAIAVSPHSGIRMEMFTSEPGLQFYSCGFMDGRDKGKNNMVYGKNCALCLEAQHFPDSPNHPDFPSTRLLPGEVYTQITAYKFSLIKE